MSYIPQFNLDGRGGEFIRTQQLEQEIASYLDVKHCVMVGSGTVALFIALRVVGAKKVAVPALTMFGTAAAVDLAGCELVIVGEGQLPPDVDTYIHVSLNGRGCDIEEIVSKYPDLHIIEDAAQSFGSMHNGQFLGTFGEIGCFSFSPHKLISAGNGGCLVTNDDRLYESMLELKNFGRIGGGADYHQVMGYNFKFTDLQSEFVLNQLAIVDEKKLYKKWLFESYKKLLGDYMIPHEGTPWFVDIYVENRDELKEFLEAKGIGTRTMYPLLNTQPALAHIETYGDFGNFEERSRKGLWIPSSEGLGESEIDFISKSVIEGVQ